MAQRAKIKAIKLPEGTPERAVREFKRIKRAMEKLNVLEIDRPALLAYLSHFALWEEAKEMVEKQGAIITTSKGQLQVNPWHSIMKQNSELLKKWVQELGFSPGSRKRLAIEMKEKPSDDELFED